MLSIFDMTENDSFTMHNITSSFAELLAYEQLQRSLLTRAQHVHHKKQRDQFSLVSQPHGTGSLILSSVKTLPPLSVIVLLAMPRKWPGL